MLQIVVWYQFSIDNSTRLSISSAPTLDECRTRQPVIRVYKVISFVSYFFHLFGMGREPRVTEITQGHLSGSTVQAYDYQQILPRHNGYVVENSYSHLTYNSHIDLVTPLIWTLFPHSTILIMTLDIQQCSNIMCVCELHWTKGGVVGPVNAGGSGGNSLQMSEYTSTAIRTLHILSLIFYSRSNSISRKMFDDLRGVSNLLQFSYR